MQLAALDLLRKFRSGMQEKTGQTDVADDCDELIRAVESFHMEAIRFRMHGLQRKLTSENTEASQFVQELKEIRNALEAAGFKI